MARPTIAVLWLPWRLGGSGANQSHSLECHNGQDGMVQWPKLRIALFTLILRSIDLTGGELGKLGTHRNVEALGVPKNTNTWDLLVLRSTCSQNCVIVAIVPSEAFLRTTFCLLNGPSGSITSPHP